MNMKKKPLYTLLSLLIVLALAMPVWSTVVRADDAIQIHDWQDLYNIRLDMGGSYILMNDLDATTAGYAELAGPDADEGKGWQPIGTSADPFTGTLDGQGYEIRDLVIHRLAENYVGLFAVVASGGTVEHVGLVNADVTGSIVVGAVAGRNYGTVSNSYSGVAVSGVNSSVGGLVGHNHGSVLTSYAIGSVTGTASIGGLVGRNDGDVEDSYSTGSVTGDGDNVGGLVGTNWGMATVSRSYATGSVAGRSRVGGLVGHNPGAVSSSYATGNVAGEGDTGGLVGWNNEGSVSDSYSRGAVSRSSGTSIILGGFVGRNLRGIIVNCYSTGSVHYEDAADPANKGFAGTVGTGGDYEMTGNFWDTETSGQTSTAGEATGKTTEEMMDIATFTGAGWDIAAVAPGATNPTHTWNIIFTLTYPFLSWQDPVGEPAALIGGQTREVSGAVLTGVTVTAYLDSELIASTVSNDPGNYALVLSTLGEYEVVTSKDGFRPETRSISIELEQHHDLHFRGDHGLVPNAPDVFYVLECVNLWLYADEPCALTVFKVLEVVNAWLYEIDD